MSRNKYKSCHTSRAIYVNDKPVPKSKLSEMWHKVKGVKWQYQDKDNYKDLIDSNYRCHPKNPKSKRLIHKMIKHKLYFNIPFTEEDKQIPYFTRIVKIEKENVERLKKKNSH